MELSPLHYTSDLQEAFTVLSGDFNPIHADPVYARRTLAGGQVVHGIHHVLATVERLLTQTRVEGISQISAQFLKPVLVGDTVELAFNPSSSHGYKITGRIADTVMFRISLQLGKSHLSSEGVLSEMSRGVVEVHTLPELSGQEGDVPFGMSQDRAREHFPRVLEILGPQALAEILGLSRVVGMHCPGLHSLFSQLTVQLEPAGMSRPLHYRVEEIDERFSRVTLAVEGSTLHGQLIAFFRPPPEPQSDMEEVGGMVGVDEFAGRTSLIIGGSRGLGETTAKIIAAGGGLPIITFHQGARDAENLADAIRAWGGRCETLQLDVRESAAALAPFGETRQTPTRLYYFATPRIFGRRRGFFSHDLLRDFNDFYVTGFGLIIDRLSRTSRSLRVFYPSSVAVSDDIPEMAEYAIAKRSGEELCAFYNKHRKGIEIQVERLPRIKTDQTNQLLPTYAESALAIMLPLVRRMERAG